MCLQARGIAAAECRNVRKVVEKRVLISCVSGAAFQHSYGFSVYFPSAEIADEYTNRDFTPNKEWYDFLVAYVRETRRPSRYGVEVTDAFESSLADRRTYLTGAHAAISQRAARTHELVPVVRKK